MGPLQPSAVTQIFVSLSEGKLDPSEATDRLFDLASAELRRVASNLMRSERQDHTLQPTALVHEAYVRLAGHDEIGWHNRVHFFGIAARAMRQVLVDHAKAHGAQKRGGDWQRVTLSGEAALAVDGEVGTLNLHDLLERLEKLDPRLARIAELKVLGGLTHAEVGEIVGVSDKTVQKEWQFAKIWLSRELVQGVDGE